MKTETAAVAVVLLVLIYLYRLGAQPATPAVAAPMPTNARERFAVDLLRAVGNDQPSAEIVAFVVAWSTAEDSGDGALSRNNPLNSTQNGFNETTTINSDGVRGYATYEDGLAATVQTLSYSAYADLVSALQTNDPDRALRALIASPWAGSRYNGGVGWPHIDIAPADTKSVVTEAMTVSADFYATGSPAWDSQGGMHYGVDYNAPHGSPVYIPFDCAYTKTGHYDDAARMGDYLMCYLLDGYEYYSGHLENVQPFTAGQVIPAGTLIGFTNSYDHTHVQLRNTGGQLVDFQSYYATH